MSAAPESAAPESAAPEYAAPEYVAPESAPPGLLSGVLVPPAAAHTIAPGPVVVGQCQEWTVEECEPLDARPRTEGQVERYSEACKGPARVTLDY